MTSGLPEVSPMPPEQWPSDGDAGICPDCNRSVYFAGDANYGYGTWFHDDGRENCNV